MSYTTKQLQQIGALTDAAVAVLGRGDYHVDLDEGGHIRLRRRRATGGSDSVGLILATPRGYKFLPVKP